MSDIAPLDYTDGTDSETIPGYISARLMAAWDFPDDHTLHLHAINNGGNGVRIRYHYILEHAGEVIFEGDDFSSGVGDMVDYAHAARGILGFLTLRPGDVDSEYFDGYTPAQIEWRDEFAEYLALYSMEPEG
jgi:hypothetical protein